jgi:hypothetical protein
MQRHRSVLKLLDVGTALEKTILDLEEEED